MQSRAGGWMRLGLRWLLPLAGAAAIGVLAVTLVSARPHGEGGERRGHGHGLGEEIAELVGTDSATLRESLKEGQTLAQIAESNGVDAQTVIDALVGTANERIAAAVEAGKLSEAEAEQKRVEIEERVTTFVHEGGGFKWGKHGKLGHHKWGGGAKLAELAELAGTDVDGLKTALGEGQTLAEIAESNGVDPQTVIAALVEAAHARIDGAVAAGKLSEAEAESKKSEAASAIEDLVNHGFDKSKLRSWGKGRWGGLGGSVERS